jgi:SAM-dependent methyltransferase
MTREWIDHADWWLGEIADDPIYQLDVLPLAADLIGTSDRLLLDLGCGEGQVMRATRGRVVGCDISSKLLSRAKSAGPVVQAALPDLSWLKDSTVDLAYAVLVLEHLADEQIFAAASRVVRDGGALVIVMNHPAFTAEGAGPLMDPSDGEMLWRWGKYFEAAACPMETDGAAVTFYHRPLATVLNAAAEAGWMLERVVEVGFSKAAIAAEPGYVGQEQMPRLLGARWMNTQGSRVSHR